MCGAVPQCLDPDVERVRQLPFEEALSGVYKLHHHIGEAVELRRRRAAIELRRSRHRTSLPSWLQPSIRLVDKYTGYRSSGSVAGDRPSNGHIARGDADADFVSRYFAPAAEEVGELPLSSGCCGGVPASADTGLSWLSELAGQAAIAARRRFGTPAPAGFVSSSRSFRAASHAEFPAAACRPSATA